MAEADYSLAPVSVDITITVTPVLPGTALATANFTATYVTDNVVLLTWDGLPTNATSVMIRVKDNGYSDNYSDGYWLYDGSGDNVTDTNVNFNEYFGYKKYTAYSWNGTDWSPFYSQAEVINPAVADLVTQLTNFNELIEDFNKLLSLSLGSILFFLLMLVMVIVAFWKRTDPVILAVSGLLTLFTGLYWIDEYAGIAIVLVVLGCYQFFNALLIVFASGKASRGLSQFIEWYHRIRGGT